MKFTKVLDKLQDKTFDMHPKTALRLATNHPQRFSIVFSNHNNQEKENIMPQLPAETKRLSNGAHILHVLEVKTTRGQYGEQEEILCVEENTGEQTRVWLPHNSRPKIMQAITSGLVTMDDQTQSWEVNIGARFQAFVAGGKVVGVSQAPVQAPMQAPAPAQAQATS